MTWVKIDDAMHLNAKVRGVSLAARWTYIASICRSGNTTSNGDILRGDLSLVDGTPKIAKELETAGLWETRPFGWYVHDYLVYNRSREQIEELKRTNSANGAKRSANGLAIRSAIRSANGSEKHGGNGSDSDPQNARSATSADPPILKTPTGFDYQQEKQSKASDSLSDSLSEETDDAVGRLCRAWESATGTTVTRMLGDQFASNLEGMPEEWIGDAIRETGMAGARSWKYTQAILDRWKTEGREDHPPPSDATDKFRNSRVVAAAEKWRTEAAK